MQKNYKFKYESSKKAQESINRYNYYLQNIVPIHFGNSTGHITQQSPINGLTYFWSKNVFQGELLVDENSIFRAIKSTHLEKDHPGEEVLKISDRTYQKIRVLEDSYLVGKWVAKEVVEFVLKVNDQKDSKTSYELYIIHHPHNENMEQKIKHLKWVHVILLVTQFVQKYTFQNQSISHQFVASIAPQTSLFGLSSNLPIFHKFLCSYKKFQSLQGNLLKYESQLKQKKIQSEDAAYSEQNNILNQIPSQFLKNFYTLKKQFGPQYQQLICRYMIAKNYQIQECRKDIREYITWFGEISGKYQWEDFQYFHKAKIFIYLGQDYKCRPVILNIARNVLVDQMDGDLYNIYYMYFLEVEMPKKMRGYVYQLNIIADVEGIGKSNFKWAITRQNIEDGKKYCAERQYKFFAVNVGSFAYFCYKFIKPLLPKKTQEKVFIGGNDKKEILENLLKDMSIEVIPTYLGGKNPII